jgi:hypothetical protein
VLDAIALENMGKPTLTIIQDRFSKAATQCAMAGGLPQIRFLVEPAPGEGISIQRDVEPLIRDNLPSILGALTKPIDAPGPDLSGRV